MSIFIIILLIIALGVSVMSTFSTDKFNKEFNIPPFLTGIKAVMLWGGLLALTSTITNSISYNERGKMTHIQKPLGGIKVVSESGYYFNEWGREDIWDKNITLVDTFDIRFNDMVSGTMQISTTFSLPDDKEGFSDIVIKHKTEEQFTNKILIMQLNAVVQTATKQMTAIDYFNHGKRAELQNLIQEQLNRGTYTSVTRSEESGPTSIQQDSIVSTYTPNEKYQIIIDKTNPTATELTTLGIKTSAVQFTLAPSDEFTERLNTQSNLTAKIQEMELTKRQQAAEQELAISQAEVAKAKRLINLEAERAQKIFEVETAEKESELSLRQKLAQVKVARADNEIRKIEIATEALAYTAGNKISPEVQYIEGQKTLRIQYITEAIKNKKVPTSIISGTGQEVNPLESYLQLMLSQELSKKRNN